MIKNILKNAFEHKNLIGITTKDIEWDQSIIGYITNYDDTSISINELDEFGFLIGNVTYIIDDILCIQIDDWYMQNLQTIHENKSMFNPNLSITIWKTGKELLIYFKIIKENEKITRFFFADDNFVIGIILDFDNEFILIKNIGQNGIEEGISCYRINDIIGLKYDGLSEQKIKLLYEMNNNTKK
ncbi:MAG: hypothetical protein LBS69_00940 [Prevotellaceae bacterium]|jgi:hypothetical protein|nr:hypothetical protein [Prevotellaceae bacterium]